MTIASPVPRTSGPSPRDHDTSVAANRNPRVRRREDANGSGWSRTRRTRAGGMCAVDLGDGGCLDGGQTRRRERLRERASRRSRDRPTARTHRQAVHTPCRSSVRPHGRYRGAWRTPLCPRRGDIAGGASRHTADAPRRHAPATRHTARALPIRRGSAYGGRQRGRRAHQRQAVGRPCAECRGANLADRDVPEAPGSGRHGSSPGSRVPSSPRASG